MDVGDLVRWAAILAGLVLLVGLALIGFLMWRYRIPPRGVVAMGVALVYLVSPIDVLPEALLGPIGLIDDTGVLAGVGFFVYRLVKARQVLVDAEVRPRRRTPRVRP